MASKVTAVIMMLPYSHLVGLIPVKASSGEFIHHQSQSMSLSPMTNRSKPQLSQDQVETFTPHCWSPGLAQSSGVAKQCPDARASDLFQLCYREL